MANPIESKHAFEHLLPAYAAIPDEEVMTPRLNLTRAVGVALGARHRIEFLRDQIADQLPSFDMAHFDDLYLSALGVRYAIIQDRMAKEPERDVPALVEEGRVLRQRLLLAGELLALD